MLAISLPEAVELRLERLAKQSGRPKSAYVEDAVVQYLQDLDDVEVAEQRLAAIYEGSSVPIPLEQVMREHGNLEH